MFRSHAKVASELKNGMGFDDLEAQVIDSGLRVLDEIEWEEWLLREDSWYVAMVEAEEASSRECLRQWELESTHQRDW